MVRQSSRRNAEKIITLINKLEQMDNDWKIIRLAVQRLD